EGGAVLGACAVLLGGAEARAALPESRATGLVDRGEAAVEPDHEHAFSCGGRAGRQRLLAEDVDAVLQRESRRVDVLRPGREDEQRVQLLRLEQCLDG